LEHRQKIHQDSRGNTPPAKASLPLLRAHENTPLATMPTRWSLQSQGRLLAANGAQPASKGSEDQLVDTSRRLQHARSIWSALVSYLIPSRDERDLGWSKTLTSQTLAHFSTSTIRSTCRVVAQAALCAAPNSRQKSAGIRSRAHQPVAKAPVDHG